MEGHIDRKERVKEERLVFCTESMDLRAGRYLDKPSSHR